MAGKAPTSYTDAALLEALGSGRYDVSTPATAWLRTSLQALDPEAAHARAQSLVERAVASQDQKARERIGMLCLPVLVQRAKALARDLEPLVTIYGVPDEVRAVFSKIAPGRRSSIMRAFIARDGTAAIDRVCEHLLDLAPDAVSAILDVYRASAHPTWALTNDVGLARAARALPVVKAALDAYRKELAAKAKAAPAPAVGPYTFTEPRVIKPSDYAGLVPVAAAQYRAAASGYLGGTIRSATHFVARLREADLDAGDAELRRWKVMKGTAHVFDLWIVWVDNGSVFPAGKKTRAPVHLVQGSWQALDKRAASKQLATDLASSAPADLWSIRPRQG